VSFCFVRVYRCVRTWDGYHVLADKLDKLTDTNTHAHTHNNTVFALRV